MDQDSCAPPPAGDLSTASQAADTAPETDIAGLGVLFAAIPKLIRPMLAGLDEQPPDHARLVLRAATEALRADPDQRELLYCAGYASAVLGHWHHATHFVKRMLDANARDIDGLILAAKVSRALGDVVGAINRVEQALAYGAQRGSVYVLQGELYLEAGNIERAHQASRRALEQNPRLTSAHDLARQLAAATRECETP